MKTRRLPRYILFFALVNLAAASVNAQSIDDRHSKNSLVGAWRLVELNRPEALVGTDLPRTNELKGNRLTVKSTLANEHWRAVWERY